MSSRRAHLRGRRHPVHQLPGRPDRRRRLLPRSASTSRWTAATAPAAPARRSASPAATTAAPTSTTRCTDDEAAAGLRAALQMKPKSDLVLQIASTSDVAKTQAATLHRRPDRARPAVGHHRRVRHRDPEPRRAGLPARAVRQHRGARHRPDAGPTRSANAPDRRDASTFLVKLTPGGVMSTTSRPRHGRRRHLVHRARTAVFFLRETERPVLLLAGGTGLAPSCRCCARCGPRRSRAAVTSIYGVNTDEDLVALDEIEEIAAGLPGFTWDYCVVGPGQLARRQQGLCHQPDRAEPSLRRRRRDLPVRAAADGRGRSRAHHEGGHRADRLLLREVRARRARRQRRSTGGGLRAGAPAQPRSCCSRPTPARCRSGHAARSRASTRAAARRQDRRRGGDLARRSPASSWRPGRPRTRCRRRARPADDRVGATDRDRGAVGHRAGDAPRSCSAPPDRPGAAVTPITPPVTMVAADGYQIGEEHPEVHDSDARVRGPRGAGARRARADHGPAEHPSSWPATGCSPSRRCPTSRATTSSTPRSTPRPTRPSTTTCSR